MNAIIFDIETGPVDGIEKMVPEFDPASVKTGNLKDPDKIAEKINQARESHAADFVDKAALSPMTGKVLAIGYKIITPATSLPAETKCLINAEDDWDIINDFWAMAQENSMHYLIGFNITQFDLPFLLRRSWSMRIPTPVLRNRRYWSDRVVDLRDWWGCGDRMASGSLDSISRFFGLAGKTEGVDGANFARVLSEDPKRAEQYLRNDVELTEQLYHRMSETFGMKAAA